MKSRPFIGLFVCTWSGDDGVEGVTAKSDASSSNMFNLVLGGCCIEWNPCGWVDVGIRTSVLTEKVQWDTHSLNQMGSIGEGGGGQS